MRPARLAGEEVARLVEGAAETEVGPHGGVLPRRLPAWARTRHDDPFFTLMELCPAGVRLRFVTRARTVHVQLHTTVVQPDGGGSPRPRFLAVTAGPDEVRSVPIPAGDVVVVDTSSVVQARETRQPSWVDVDVTRPDLGTPVELWLPHDCLVEVVAIHADDVVQPAPPDERLRWTHYGSSISHGFEAPTPDRTWPAHVAIAAGWRLHNLAFGGNAQLDPFVARMIRDTAADLVTLKVGINLVNADSMRRRAMLPSLHGFLDLVRDGHPSTPIVLITALACPVHEDAAGPSVTRDGRAAAAHRHLEADDGALTLAATREVLAQVHADRSPLDPHLHVLDGRSLFGADDTRHLYDGLHPDPEGLMLIARRFPSALATSLGNDAAILMRGGSRNG